MHTSYAAVVSVICTIVFASIYVLHIIKQVMFSPISKDLYNYPDARMKYNKSDMSFQRVELNAFLIRLCIIKKT